MNSKKFWMRLFPVIFKHCDRANRFFPLFSNQLTLKPIKFTMLETLFSATTRVPMVPTMVLQSLITSAITWPDASQVATVVSPTPHPPIITEEPLRVVADCLRIAVSRTGPRIPRLRLSTMTTESLQLIEIAAVILIIIAIEENFKESTKLPRRQPTK